MRALKRLAKPVQHRRMTRGSGNWQEFYALHQTASVGQMSSQEYCKHYASYGINNSIGLIPDPVSTGMLSFKLAPPNYRRGLER